VSGAAEPQASRRERLRSGLRALLYELRVEGHSPARQACAIALGVFIGCTPLYGLHLPLCIVLARLFGLNRLKTYIAAHISTPVLLPFLLFGEIQVGRLLRGARPLSIHPGQLKEDFAFWHWRARVSDLLVGSLVVGLVLGALFGLLTYWLVRRGRKPPAIEALIENTAHRYINAGLVHTEYVRGKLRHDPVYFALLEHGLLPRRGELLDLGCGRATPYALLLTAVEQLDRDLYPVGWPPPPALETLSLRGIESRPKIAAVARQALGGAAQIESGDLLVTAVPPIDGALLVDVLHYLRPAEQKRILAEVATALRPGGRLLLREADAAGGWRFLSVRLGERLSALLRGHWRQRFFYRSTSAWLEILSSLGFAASPQQLPARSGNVLIVADRRSATAPAP
jgi:uncharacterized protein (DUF2062 family)/SAM-dependent methyltransferase